MYYLLDISEKNFGRIVAKSEALMTVNFHRNFMVKTLQADEHDLMIVDVGYDAMFASFGVQPWVASWDGPEDTDPWSAGDTEEEALDNFIYIMERNHV
jgi:hypothetical protein